MNAHITVNLPDDEFELEYTDVESLDKLIALIETVHPDAESLVIVVTL